MDEPFPLFAEIAECLWKKQDCQFTLDPKGDKPRYGKCNLDSEPAYLMASQVECVAGSVSFGQLHSYSVYFVSEYHFPTKSISNRSKIFTTIQVGHREAHFIAKC